MLIRSQDKKTLITINNVSGISIGIRGDKKEYIITSHGIDGSCNFIGNYSSEKKALKVLDMMQDKYCTLDETSLLFQMPQESEVM